MQAHCSNFRIRGHDAVENTKIVKTKSFEMIVTKNYE